MHRFFSIVTNTKKGEIRNQCFLNREKFIKKLTFSVQVFTEIFNKKFKKQKKVFFCSKIDLLIVNSKLFIFYKIIKCLFLLEKLKHYYQTNKKTRGFIKTQLINEMQKVLKK